MPVRPALPSDVPAIIALHQRVIAEGAWFVATPGEALRPIERWRSDLSAAIFLVAPTAFGIAGWIRIRTGPYLRNRHVGYLDMMIDSDHRGQGLGKSLMEAALQEASHGGVLKKIALAVYADNDRAIALYRRFGFVEEGRRVAEYLRDGVLADDLILAKFLDPAVPAS